uniref:Uncharacterized protein n=1 Tax=Ananas comosus var. bracteatus TaxID=296719 RepID=A0A6V7QPE8_ANACO|nr:unnamed protein product [Ananas comosus var. bracteatus]
MTKATSPLQSNSSNTWSARDRESGKGDTKNNHSQLFVNSMFLRRGVGKRERESCPPAPRGTCCPCERPAPGARSRPHVLPAVSDPHPPPARALARPRVHLLPCTDPLWAPARARLAPARCSCTRPPSLAARTVRTCAHHKARTTEQQQSKKEKKSGEIREKDGKTKDKPFSIYNSQRRTGCRTGQATGREKAECTGEGGRDVGQDVQQGERRRRAVERDVQQGERRRRSVGRDRQQGERRRRSVGRDRQQGERRRRSVGRDRQQGERRRRGTITKVERTNGRRGANAVSYGRTWLCSRRRKAMASRLRKAGWGGGGGWGLAAGAAVREGGERKTRGGLETRGVHASSYDKNVEDLVHPVVLPDHVIEAAVSDKYWGPHPTTGVFGPAAPPRHRHRRTKGRAGQHSCCAAGNGGGSTVLDQKVWFRPLRTSTSLPTTRTSTKPVGH